MSNDSKVRVHGVPKPEGTSWLKEVRLDAARNTVEQLRRQAEAREFEAAKARGITTEDVISKGREDLGVEPREVAVESDSNDRVNEAHPKEQKASK